MSNYDRALRVIADVGCILGKHSIRNYEQEARWLVLFVADIPESSSADLLHLNLSSRQIGRIYSLVKKRCSGIPLAVLFREANFFGYNFFVNKQVLIPRIDSEVLVERFLEACKKWHDHNFVIVDICSGSGCLSISTALRLQHLSGSPSPTVVCIDISKRAMKIALKNADKFLSKGTFLDFVYDVRKKSFESKFLSFLLEHDLSNKPIFIISNPPYIKTRDLKSVAKVVSDPIIALDGGNSGLLFYDRIFDILRNLQKIALLNIRSAFFEIGFDQAEEIKNLLEEKGMILSAKYQDAEDRDRVVEVGLET